MDNKQDELEKIEKLIIQYMEHIANSMEKLMKFFEKRTELIEQLKKEDEKK